MRIRTDQAARLAAERDFEENERLARHIRAFARTTWCVAGEPGLRVLVAVASDRAKRMDLGRERGLEYVKWSVLLGYGFDDDPQLSWAKPRGPGGGRWRQMDRRGERARRYVARVHGGDGEHLRAALQAFVDGPSAGLSLPAKERFETGMLAAFARLFPQKSEVVGEARLVRLLREAPADGATLGLANAEDLAVYTTIQSPHASSFIADARYDWSEAALAARGPVSAGERLSRAARERLGEELSRNRLEVE